MTPILNTLFGSWIYGTNLPTSDHDYKTIFLPSPREIVLSTAKEAYNETTKQDQRAKNSAEDVETEYFSLKKYMNLLLEGQTVAVDLLFTPKEFHVEGSPIWEDIVNNKDKWLHSGVSSFVGYCRTQANRFGIKGSRVAASRAATELLADLISKHGHLAKCKEHWDIISAFGNSGIEHVSMLDGTVRRNLETKVNMIEVCNRKVQEHVTLKEAHSIFKAVFDEYGQRALQAEKNENVDSKALMHAVRILNQAKELLSTGNITFPRPEKNLLLQIRKGEIPYRQIAEILESGMVELLDIQLQSSLQKTPDTAFANDFIYSIYLDHIVASRVL